MSRWSEGRGPYIRMAPSGAKFYLQKPRPEDFNLLDTAYHLAGINRYTGGSRFSVAQHMVVGANMARRFYPQHPLLPARFLIHDIAESVIGDMSSPLKSLFPNYKELEREYDLAIEERFGVTFIGDQQVKELDDRMWLTERLVVYRDTEVDVSEDVENIPLEPFPLDSVELDYLFKPWGPDVAKEAYLSAIERHFPGVQ